MDRYGNGAMLQRSGGPKRSETILGGESRGKTERIRHGAETQSAGRGPLPAGDCISVRICIFIGVLLQTYCRKDAFVHITVQNIFMTRQGKL